MIKKLFVLLGLVVIVALVAMTFTKPDRQAHFNAVARLAQNMVDKELSNIPLPLPDEVVNIGSETAMGAANMYLLSNLMVNDYFFVNVGTVNHHGTAYPVTVGVFNKVFLLVDEEQVRQAIKP
jgi:hypothetical protein